LGKTNPEDFRCSSQPPFLSFFLQLQNGANNPIEVIWMDHSSDPIVPHSMMILEVNETVHLSSYDGHQFLFKYLNPQDKSSSSPPSLLYTKLDLSESLHFFFDPIAGFTVNQVELEESGEYWEEGEGISTPSRESSSFVAVSPAPP
jgi:hypothetical protein